MAERGFRKPEAGGSTPSRSFYIHILSNQHMGVSALSKTDEKKSGVPLATAFKSIHIALDNYNDIFSDFDISPFSRRTVSDDFLHEIEKRHVETEKGDFEVRLTLPQKFRDAKAESVIKKRLRDFFATKLRHKEKEIGARKRTGIIKLITGLAVVVAIFELSIGYDAPFATFASVFALYSLFTGFENIFEVPGKLEQERQLFRKFSKARYHFLSEEEVIEQLKPAGQDP